MNKSYIERISDNISDRIFFLILFVYQFLFIFQGMDVADEGFFMTFYQQIFKNPESFVMNFLYWFTGIVGGIFYYLFPSSGILGMRILGISIILTTSILTYNLLKNNVNKLNLRIGILFVVLFVNSNDIKEMYYDNLSSLLTILSSILIFKGLVKNRLILIAFSGAFISLSMFTRIPSMAMLIFLLAIFYYGFISKNKIITIAKQGASFLSGFVLMTIVILCLMQLIGHLSVYLETLKIGFGWAASTDDSHNLMRLIRSFIYAYSKSLIWGLILCLIPFILNFIQNLIAKYTNAQIKLLSNISGITTIFIFLVLLIANKISYSNLLTLFAGISLITSLFVLTGSRYNHEKKLLVLLGILFLLFAPLGSAGGLYAAGRSAFWLILPLAFDFFLSIKSINGEINIDDRGNYAQKTNISLNQWQLITFKNYFLAMCMLSCLYFSYYYPYFDMSNRIKMYSGIENKLAKGIFTTPERATAINELLIESSKYVRKNDLVLAYDNIPMYHYFTETRPYLPNTWPWLYLPEQFSYELTTAQQKSNKLPVVILQKVNTLASNWPMNINNDRTKTAPEIQRDSIMANFLKTNHYIQVWENNAFEIRVPNN